MMIQLPSTRGPRTAIPAGTTDLPLGTCTGSGRVHLPTTDGGAQLFICGGCANCQRTRPVSAAVPGSAAELAAAADAQRRRMRMADAFAPADDEEAF